MAIHRMGFLLPLLIVVGVTTSSAAHLGRNGFPDGFIFGCASSSYQYEGGAAEGGKGPSIWDTFTHKHPEKIVDRSNGDVAIDSYHRYKEDVNLLKDMNMDAYRFSIAWPRILPNGSLSGGINREGINYYNNLINYLLSKGMQPFVTLFHWDTPQTLDDAYGSFLSEKIIVDFHDYAEVCFQEFGDRVKHWITFNEPYTYCRNGYGTGAMPPGRCSPWVGNCSGGDSGREPYIAGHNMLLAHAATVRLYNEKYKAFQKGSIGITLVSSWFVPLSKSNANSAAVARALDFTYGWFMNPLTYGDYPVTMRSLVGNRLPKFTKEQSEMVRGSFDFLGLNYYTTYYVSSSLPLSNQINASYDTDSGTNTTGIRNGKPIGRRAASAWLFVYPPGIRKLLLYTKTKYKNPVVYITENGVDEANSSTLSLEEALEDDPRIDYISKHVLYMRRAIREGIDVRGYFAWSLLDNFEWSNGYTVRFGLNYVDYNNGLKRYPKKSALWISKLLKK